MEFIIGLMGLAFTVWLFFVFVKEMMPSEEQKAYKQATTSALQCEREPE